jgi:hypothetical protein
MTKFTISAGRSLDFGYIHLQPPVDHIVGAEIQAIRPPVDAMDVLDCRFRSAGKPDEYLEITYAMQTAEDGDSAILEQAHNVGKFLVSLGHEVEVTDNVAYFIDPYDTLDDSASEAA